MIVSPQETRENESNKSQVAKRKVEHDDEDACH